jgi:uroporphyrin-III C-methyltransferase/precorrin-2 dehydrogenase/sirohydrochlorin ferrochelatase
MPDDEDLDPLPQGGFFPVSLNLEKRRCLVIGPADDREAIEKEEMLREVGADVRRIFDGEAFRDEDVVDAFFVISTPKDEALSSRLRALADRHRFLLCCIDQPAFGFVAMQAIVKAGPARIGISTGGVAPRVGKILKERLQTALDGRFTRFMNTLAERRRANRSRLKDVAARREAMVEAAKGFDVKIAVQYPDWFEKDSDGIR